MKRLVCRCFVLTALLTTLPALSEIAHGQPQEREFPQPRQKFGRGIGRSGAVEQNRLGVRLAAPDENLVAELGLADGTGIVLTEVPESSVAAKAGFLPNDVLLKLAGKDVSSVAIEFIGALDAIKADAPVDAVVLRKGKEWTIKGIKLPELAPVEPRGNLFFRKWAK